MTPQPMISRRAYGRDRTKGRQRAATTAQSGHVERHHAIAGFLPYCGAMFLDNECAGLLREEPRRTKLASFGTRVFSSKTGDEFLAYLAGLYRAGRAGTGATRRRRIWRRLERAVPGDLGT